MKIHLFHHQQMLIGLDAVPKIESEPAVLLPLQYLGDLDPPDPIVTGTDRSWN
jgi:hypothetical protein